MSFTIPNLSGRLAVITGAAGGLGYETALALAGANATVVVAGRNPHKGADALARIRAAHPRADVSFAALDLGSLASVEAFATGFAKSHDKLDILVNNAGVMMPPRRQVTTDGFELQFGTNHLGHFALTARLMPLLTATPGARVVTVSSIAHRNGSINFDDLQWTRSYAPMTAYGQSKLANLIFAQELQRRSDAAGWGLTSIAAHPGVASTDLIANGMGDGLTGRAAKVLIGIFGRSAASGALPQIFAATSPEAQPGAYYGPAPGLDRMGKPRPASMSAAARDAAVARRLWAVSEDLVGLRFPVLAEAA